ncbi:MAG: LysM peptidoglycan-binding domain-containing protein [Butyrivibrio sp.]|nr:LysM peptidoglycan-binding domain-containing protein [Butyrivibrio sp.]MBR1642445.1 LysM peptidoglycan-binding domain-containing protein [Butyrivibrio sp.]
MSDAMRAAASLYNDPRYFSASEVRIRKNKLRRARIFRRQVFLLFAAIAVLIFTGILFASTIKSNAQSDEFVPSFKYYKTVTVHTDDNMWSIARENYSPDHYDDVKAYITEICSINNISDPDRLSAGENIVIPYYSEEFK